jgi:hypothetical protein
MNTNKSHPNHCWSYEDTKRSLVWYQSMDYQERQIQMCELRLSLPKVDMVCLLIKTIPGLIQVLELNQIFQVPLEWYHIDSTLNVTYQNPRVKCWSTKPISMGIVSRWQYHHVSMYIYIYSILDRRMHGSNRRRSGCTFTWLRDGIEPDDAASSLHYYG